MRFLLSGEVKVLATVSVTVWIWLDSPCKDTGMASVRRWGGSFDGVGTCHWQDASDPVRWANKQAVSALRDGLLIQFNESGTSQRSAASPPAKKPPPRNVQHPNVRLPAAGEGWVDVEDVDPAFPRRWQPDSRMLQPDRQSNPRVTADFFTNAFAGGTKGVDAGHILRQYKAGPAAKWQFSGSLVTRTHPDPGFSRDRAPDHPTGFTVSVSKLISSLSPHLWWDWPCHSEKH